MTKMQIVQQAAVAVLREFGQLGFENYGDDATYGTVVTLAAMAAQQLLRGGPRGAGTGHRRDLRR